MAAKQKHEPVADESLGRLQQRNDIFRRLLLSFGLKRNVNMYGRSAR